MPISCLRSPSISAAFLLVAACGSSSDTPATPPSTPPAAAPAGAPGAAGDVLLDTDGTLAVDGRASWTVPVRADERIRVTVTSGTFDPILVVQPPGSGRLSNDDFNGDRTRSELDLRIATAGDLKIEVAVWGAPGPGTFHVHAERVSTPAPAIAAAPPATHHLPWGAAPLPGTRGYVAGAVPAAAAAAPSPAAVRVGERVEASLGSGDATLPSGEFADHYALTVTEPGRYTIQMESRALDSFLVVTGPSGERLENDDSGGSLDSSVDIDARAPGEWRIVATTYRPGMAGAYQLKVLSARDVVAAAAGAPGAAPGVAGAERVERGELRGGDTQLSSGEWYDSYDVTWPVGTAVHLEARSSAFDTYLILRTPSGRQVDNDDQVPGNLNAAIDFVVSEAGPHRVLVTSYAPGMSGAYELGIRGGGTPAVAAPSGAVPGAATVPPVAPPAAVAGARTERGELAAGDRTLGSGEFMDSFPMTFTPGAPVSVRLESTEFDTYLIVRSPSGRQQDNDDIRPGILNSGIDIPSAEAGEYQVTVTSYRPGETGHYTLTAGAGTPGAPSVAVGGGPSPGSIGPAPGAAAGPIPTGGTRVWTVSVGISDYPGSANDLPECANDAVKIAEALRNQGLTATDREFLLTDANATRANVRDALTRVAAGIQPGDVFVFFYSGHGGQTRAARADDPNELDGLDEYMVAYDGNIGDDELGTLIGNIHARTTLVALDSCFSGGFAKDVVNRPDVVGMFSSEEDVTSGVAPEFRAGGYLSHFLRMGIGGEGDADPRDRALTVGELSHYVWRQYAEHGVDLRMGEGYQHLVVDRGSVHNDTVLWNVGS